jgi:hypothetical protein
LLAGVVGCQLGGLALLCDGCALVGLPGSPMLPPDMLQQRDNGAKARCSDCGHILLVLPSSAVQLPF